MEPIAGLWPEVLRTQSEILNKDMILQNKANFHRRERRVSGVILVQLNNFVV
jgi:hypothetical protein